MADARTIKVKIRKRRFSMRMAGALLWLAGKLIERPKVKVANEPWKPVFKLKVEIESNP